MTFRRYRMKTITTDVLVIGAGAAGIRAALAASEAGVDVVMVAKSPPAEGGSSRKDGRLEKPPRSAVGTGHEIGRVE